MTLAIERRSAVRHETADERPNVQLMDWLGPRIREGELINISSGGALIRASELPPLHRPLRVRLQIAKEIGWFSAIPVRVGGPNEVGIQFLRPLPLYFLGNSSEPGAENSPRADSDSAQTCSPAESEINCGTG
jgi:PilZ domain